MQDFTSTLLSTLIGAVPVLIAAFLTGRIAQYVAKRRTRMTLEQIAANPPEPKPLLETKIELVATLSGQLSRLNEEIKEEFELQVEESRQLREKRDQLNKDIAEATEVNAIQQAAADALNARVTRGVTQGVEEALAKKGKTDTKLAVGLAIGGFVAGSIVTFVVSYVFFVAAVQAG